MFFLLMCEFSMGTPVSSHSLKIAVHKLIGDFKVPHKGSLSLCGPKMVYVFAKALD